MLAVATVIGASVISSVIPTSLLSIDLDFDATLEAHAIGLRLESPWTLPAPLSGLGGRAALKDVRLIPDAPMTGPLASWSSDEDVALLRVRPRDGEASASARLQSLVLPAGAYLRVELGPGNRLSVKPCGVFSGELQLDGPLRVTEDGPDGVRDDVLELSLIEAVGFRQPDVPATGCPDGRATVELERPLEAETALGALRFGELSLHTSDEARRSALVGGTLELARTGDRIALVPGDEVDLDDVSGAIRSWHVDGERGVLVAHVTGRAEAVSVATTSATAERGMRSVTPSMLEYLMTFPLFAMFVGWIGIGSLSNLFRRLGSVPAAPGRGP